jgi:hypothetical protein
VIALLLAAGLACGAERRAVKMVTDHAPIDPRPIATTVEALAALPLATPVHGHEPRGVRPEEFHVYQVEAVIGFAKRETDQDAHIVLLDGLSTMIVESVHPRCAAGSVVLPQIKAVRASILKAIGAKNVTTAALRRLKGKRVRVTGVFFADKLHGQTGVAVNGAELHPILGFELLEP